MPEWSSANLPSVFSNAPGGQSAAMCSNQIPGQTTLPPTRSISSLAPFSNHAARSEEILLHHLPDIVSPAVQYRASRIKRHSDRGFDGHERRHHELHGIEVHMQERRSRLGQPDLDGALELVRLGDRSAP